MRLLQFNKGEKLVFDVVHFTVSDAYISYFLKKKQLFFKKPDKNVFFLKKMRLKYLVYESKF
jgi:hypothetical protein